MTPHVADSRRRFLAGRRFRLSASSASATNGAVAQLGERLNGIQEVGGSTPLSSTRSRVARAAAGISPACCRHRSACLTARVASRNVTLSCALRHASKTNLDFAVEQCRFRLLKFSEPNHRPIGAWDEPIRDIGSPAGEPRASHSRTAASAVADSTLVATGRALRTRQGGLRSRCRVASVWASRGRGVDPRRWTSGRRDRNERPNESGHDLDGTVRRAIVAGVLALGRSAETQTVDAYPAGRAGQPLVQRRPAERQQQRCGHQRRRALRRLLHGRHQHPSVRRGDSNGFTDVYRVRPRRRRRRRGSASASTARTRMGRAWRSASARRSTATAPASAFSSDATNLVAGRHQPQDRRLRAQPARRRRRMLASIGLDGEPANGASSFTSLPADCSQIAFQSVATQPGPGRYQQRLRRLRLRPISGGRSRASASAPVASRPTGRASRRRSAPTVVASRSLRRRPTCCRFPARARPTPTTRSTSTSPATASSPAAPASAATATKPTR